MKTEEVLKRIDKEIRWRELFLATTPPYLGPTMHLKTVEDLEFYKHIRSVIEGEKKDEKKI